MTFHSDREIEDMFAVLLDSSLSGSGLEFIESLYEQWQDKNWLSDKQEDALVRFYERHS